MKAIQLTKTTEPNWYVLLEGIFFGIAGLAFWKMKVNLATIDLMWLGMATFFMARTVSFRQITEFIRAPFTEVLPDSCGAGEDVHARGSGLQYAIGSLFSCPICTGTWTALILTITWVYIDKSIVYIFAIAGVSEMLHYAANLLEWHGRLARVKSGQISPDKR